MNSSLAVIIGSGSAARQHAYALRALGFRVQFITSRSLEGEETLTTIEEALKNHSIELVVIANESYKHQAEITNLIRLKYQGNLMCEKPLYLSSETPPNMQFKKFRVGFNLRYEPSLLKFKKCVEQANSNIDLVVFHYGKNLKLWRPERDHLTNYSAHRKLGGGVLWDLSHEVDMAHWLLGDLEITNAYGGRISNVTVDSDDFWDIKFKVKADSIIGQIRIDSLDYMPERYVKFYFKDFTLYLDLLKKEIFNNTNLIWKQIKPNNSFLDMYKDILFNENDTACNYPQALKIESFIQGAFKINTFKEYGKC